MARHGTISNAITMLAAVGLMALFFVTPVLAQDDALPDRISITPYMVESVAGRPVPAPSPISWRS